LRFYGKGPRTRPLECHEATQEITPQRVFGGEVTAFRVLLPRLGTSLAFVKANQIYKPTVLHPQRFPDTAVVARLFAEAATRLAALKKDPKR
jgi:hypothetical protein